MPTPVISQAIAVAPTPALAAVFCGIEKMPPPTIEPTTRAVSAPTRSLVVFGGFMQTSRYQPPTMGWNSST